MKRQKLIYHFDTGEMILDRCNIISKLIKEIDKLNQV